MAIMSDSEPDWERETSPPPRPSVGGSGSSVSEGLGDGVPSETNGNAADSADPSITKCVKCYDEVPITETHSAGRAGVRVCKLCYNANRALTQHFTKRGKKDEWMKMAPAKKRKMIVDNKYSGGVRGKERNIVIREEVEISDKMGVSGEIPHLNKFEFTNECKKRWNMQISEINDFWQECLSDPMVPKGTDERGCQTVAKLKKLVIKAGREVSHNRNMSHEQRVKCQDADLPELKNKLVMGMDMAIDSGIFDFGNIGFLSDLPGIGPQNVKTKSRAGLLTGGSASAGGNASRGSGTKRSHDLIGATSNENENPNPKHGMSDGKAAPANATSNRAGTGLSSSAKDQLAILDRERKSVRALSKWETAIRTEHKSVMDTLKTAEPYSDMVQFSSSCMNWLVVLIRMGPDACQSLLHEQENPEEPLSPKSKDLRSHILQTRAPLTEMMTKYESNMKSKPADVQSIRKKLDKMVQKQWDTERAEAELRKKKEHKEALEREAHRKKQEVEIEATVPEAVNVREGMPIPVQVDGLLTHKSLAIYEMIREGIFHGNGDPPLEPSQRVHVVYQDFLNNPSYQSLCDLAREGKPVLYQCDTTVENRDESHVQHQKPPVWWEKCSAKLQSSCQACIPEKDVPSSYVFMDQHVQEAFSCFDWLSVQAEQMGHHFPELSDAEVIKSLRSLTIQRHAKDSNVIGIFDKLCSKVLYCVKGARLYIGMSVRVVMESYEKQFKTLPESLKQCASWVHQMSLEEIMRDGFFSWVSAGDVLVMPACNIVFEACIGQVGADMITWPCLLPGDKFWMQEVHHLKQAGLLHVDPNACERYQQIMTSLNDGTVVLEKLLLLSDVKTEEPSRVTSEKVGVTVSDVSAPSLPTMAKPVETPKTAEVEMTPMETADAEVKPSQEQHDDDAAATAATSFGDIDSSSSLDLTKADFGLGLPNPNSYKLEDLESAVRRWYVDRVGVDGQKIKVDLRYDLDNARAHHLFPKFLHLWESQWKHDWEFGNKGSDDMFLWLEFLSQARDDNASEPPHVLPPQKNESIPPHSCGTDHSDEATATIPNHDENNTDAIGDVTKAAPSPVAPLAPPNPAATAPESKDDDNVSVRNLDGVSEALPQEAPAPVTPASVVEKDPPPFHKNDENIPEDGGATGAPHEQGPVDPDPVAPAKGPASSEKTEKTEVSELPSEPQSQKPELDATPVDPEHQTRGKGKGGGNGHGKGQNVPVINRHVLGAFHNPDVARMDSVSRSKVFEDCYKKAESTVYRPSSTSSVAEKLAKQANIQTAFILGAHNRNGLETGGTDPSPDEPNAAVPGDSGDRSLEDALEELMEKEYPASPAVPPGPKPKPKPKAKVAADRKTPSTKVAVKSKPEPETKNSAGDSGDRGRGRGRGRNTQPQQDVDVTRGRGRGGGRGFMTRGRGRGGEDSAAAPKSGGEETRGNATSATPTSGRRGAR